MSQNKISDTTGYTNYMTVLTNDALGNYYNVMKDVTLTPAIRGTTDDGFRQRRWISMRRRWRRGLE
ncbi:MAG TPA: hypothetical protein VGJ06_18460 [Candidatus Acidoferrum sp.]